MSEPRYFVDERCGCIAVIDRTKDYPDRRGLHEDTEGVVQYWHGRFVPGDSCVTCGKPGSGAWQVDEDDIAEAHRLCSELNQQVPA